MASRDFDVFCTRTDRPGQTGAAALAELARRHGVDVSPREVVARAGLPRPEMDLFALLLAARRCGFEAVPLEGGFDDLPEVPRPNIVLFHDPDGERPDCMVLLDIDARSALIGDTIEGRVRRLDRDEFTARWTGDAIQLLPDAAGLAAFRVELAAQRDPWVRNGRRLGLVPMTAKKLGFAVLVLLTAAAVALPAADSSLALALRAALGLATALSLWLTAFTATCVSCSGAALLVGGLPLAPAGLALYSALLAASLVLPSPTAAQLPVVLAAAAGLHLALIALLLRSPYRCVPCFGVAAAVLTALVLAHTQHPAAPLTTGAVLVGGFAAARGVFGLARRRFALELQDGALRLATKTLAEPDQLGFGQVRLVVYKRSRCVACSYYDLAIRLQLIDEFGDALVLEERQPDRGSIIATPMFVVRGSADFLITGLGSEHMLERLRAVLNAALSPGPRELGSCGGLHIIRA